MNKKQKRWGVWDLVLVVMGLIPGAAAILLYDQLPDPMASHFGVNGNVDGYQGKLSFLLLLGLLSAGLPILMKVTRFIDPKRDNYEKFNRAFEIIRFVTTAFFSIIFGFILIYNLGYQMNVQNFIMFMLGIMLIVMGNYVGQFRFNFLVGIRTPWTLTNEQVWRRTHRMAGPLWMITGVVSLICAYLPGDIAVWLFGLALAVAVLLPMIYSYLLYRRIGK